MEKKKQNTRPEQRAGKASGQVKLTGFQRRYELFLEIAAAVVTCFHFWLSFTRHMWAPENLMFRSDILPALMTADLWTAILFGAAVLVYVMITAAYLPKSMDRIRAGFRRYLSVDGIILAALFLWFVVCCLYYGRGTMRLVVGYWPYVMDMGICTLILFPLPGVLGWKKTKTVLEWVFHAIMAFSTCFAVWALWNLFTLDIVTLPNGLSVGMDKKTTFYMGVNTNIGAAIGVTMILICLYMAATHRGAIRWVYATALLPHLTATLLTNSRANFIALLVVLPAFAFMLAWHGSRKLLLWQRIAAGLAAALGMGVLLWFLRYWVFDLFESISGMKATQINKQGLLKDSGRLKLWPACLRLMTRSPEDFFFGTPIADFFETIKAVKNEMYNSTRYSGQAHAHNMILQIGVTMGMPAMLAFVGYLVITFLRCLRVGLVKSRGQMKGMWALPLGILALVIVNMFEPFIFLYFSAMGCLFCLYAGWVKALDKGEE